MSEISTSDTKMQRRREEDLLGADILDECRTQLMMKFRFLDLALWRMNLAPLRAGSRYPLSTDTNQVYYDPPRVIGRFRQSFEESVRDYLHMVMHCVFRHPFDKNHDDLDAWGLTCDILVESAIMDLCGTRFLSEDDDLRRDALNQMQMMVGRLVPGKLYLLIKALNATAEGQHYRGLGPSVLAQWRSLFERDDHGAWPSSNANKQDDPDKQERGAGQTSEEEEQDDSENNSEDLKMEIQGEADPADAPEKESEQDDKSSSQTRQESEQDETSEKSQEQNESDDGGALDVSAADAVEDESGSEPEQKEKEWEEIAKQIEMNLETFSKEWGEEAGTFLVNLSFANRKTYAYTDFLRKFMVVSEQMQLNHDEFDYLYYTYGLDLYGNMPLVELLEYQETHRICDFAIVIDTSESVKGELVQRFLQHTFDILNSSQDYAREVNIHLIQCDARVQTDQKITNLGDIDTLMQDFSVRGFGGTDFRPAFDYVEMLQGQGELRDLKGLIYFTDGLGQFPEKPPSYDAAFVFMDEDGRELPPVPPWAMKVVVDEAGISSLEV